jgi:hypothetical protein
MPNVQLVYSKNHSSLNPDTACPHRGAARFILPMSQPRARLKDQAPHSSSDDARNRKNNPLDTSSRFNSGTLRSRGCGCSTTSRTTRRARALCGCLRRPNDTSLYSSRSLGRCFRSICLIRGNCIVTRSAKRYIISESSSSNDWFNLRRVDDTSHSRLAMSRNRTIKPDWVCIVDR